MQKAVRRGVIYAAFSIAFFISLACTLLQANDSLGRMERLAEQRYGPQAAETVAAWRSMINASIALSDTEKLARVNTFFNRHILFKDDIVVWGQQDYWATPLETMGKGAGDCEDFAIAKYATLKLLGISPDALRLIYVRAQLGGLDSGLTRAHMVVGYYATPDSEPLVLDNLITDILPAAQRRDLFPVFSFNSDGLWVNTTGRSAKTTDPTTRLSPWRDVIERMRKDGLQ